MVKHFAAIVNGQQISTHTSSDAAWRAIRQAAHAIRIDPYSDCNVYALTVAGQKYLDRAGKMEEHERKALLMADTDTRKLTGEIRDSMLALLAAHDREISARLRMG